MISRATDAEIAARRARQRRVAAHRAAKTKATIERRAVAPAPQAPQQAVSEVLNVFRREYDLLTEGEQITFERAVKAYVLGRLTANEWRNFTRAIRASYLASMPPEPPIGGGRVKAKDRWVSPPQGW
jgi:hypothetical protein